MTEMEMEMSNRTLLEINHDCSHLIGRSPEAFQRALRDYMGSGSKESARHLERWGIRVFGMRHHSEGFYIRWGRFAKRIIEGDSNN
jgi:hypothetical protein